jgi:hypothetical protein
MDRRTKERLDLQLVCRVGSGKSSPAASPDEHLMSENFSRNGILLRWLPNVKMPEIGAKMTVDVGLPTPAGAAPRAMRCNATVIRIQRRKDHHHLVGFEIGKIRFVKADPRVWGDLHALATPNNLVN